MSLLEMITYCNPAVILNLKVNNKVVFSGLKKHINNKYLNMTVVEYEVDDCILVFHLI